MPRTVKIIPQPAEWQQNFRRHAMRSTFVLTLTRPMMEFLCAVSDGVRWDRAIFNSLHLPDNWIATGEAVARRGLIVPKSPEELEALRRRPCRTNADLVEWNTWRLTPAGDAVIQLMKATGLFVDGDIAANKKKRKA